jgi:hypothetical protein
MTQRPQHDVIVRRGHRGNLPVDLKFAGLVAPQGIEIIRIRFSLDLDKELDLPLSAETLADLMQVLAPLDGKSPAQMPEEIAYLRDHLGVRIADE